MASWEKEEFCPRCYKASGDENYAAHHWNYDGQTCQRCKYGIEAVSWRQERFGWAIELPDGTLAKLRKRVWAPFRSGYRILCTYTEAEAKNIRDDMYPEGKVIKVFITLRRADT